jgi:hypothetical protein
VLQNGQTPLEDFFTMDEWLYFVNLNYDVNQDLHSELPEGNRNKITVVLKDNHYNVELVKGALAKFGYTNVDVKHAVGDLDI